MSSDFKHITCHLVLIAADALTPEQLQRKREGKNALEPLNDEQIDLILESWRRKLRKEIKNSGGYFVLGYDA